MAARSPQERRTRRRLGQALDVAGAICIGALVMAFPLAALVVAFWALIWLAARAAAAANDPVED